MKTKKILSVVLCTVILLAAAAGVFQALAAGTLSGVVIEVASDNGLGTDASPFAYYAQFRAVTTPAEKELTGKVNYHYVVTNKATGEVEEDEYLKYYDYIEVWLGSGSYTITVTVTNNGNTATASRDFVVSSPLEYGDLVALINYVKNLKEKDYTAESWADLMVAYEQALAVNGSTGVTQRQINEAFADLYVAIRALESAPPSGFFGWIVYILQTIWILLTGWILFL